MWIRKSEEEISELRQKKELEKKSLKRPIIFASIATIIYVILYLFGFRGSINGVLLFSSNAPQVWRMLFLGMILFIFCFIIERRQQKREGQILGNSTMLCRECKEPSYANERNICSCGGTLEPFEFFEWQEESVMQESKI